MGKKNNGSCKQLQQSRLKKIAFIFSFLFGWFIGFIMNYTEIRERKQQQRPAVKYCGDL